MVLAAIARANERLGTTTIIITHNAAIAGMADRVLRLGGGRIVGEERNARRLSAAPGMPWNWGHRMFSESRVIISTMLRLAREHNIPSAPVYDSLIVPRSKEEIAEGILDEQFIQIVGVKPTLKIRPLPARYF